MKLAHHAMTWEGWCHRNNTEVDAAAVFREVAEAGYAGVEISPSEVWGTPEAARARAEENELTIAAVATAVAAVPYEPSHAEFKAACTTARALGVDTLMLCGGFLGTKRRVNLPDDIPTFAGVLRECCRVVDDHGLTVAFHPHVGCLIETTEQTEQLLDTGLADAPRFALCMDTGHLAAVGSDPLSFVDRFGNRIAHVHLKDWHDAPGAGQFVELGAGNAGLDFAAITGRLASVGYDGWYVVETDRCAGTPAESAAQSRQHLDAALGAAT